MRGEQDIVWRVGAYHKRLQPDITLDQLKSIGAVKIDVTSVNVIYFLVKNNQVEYVGSTVQTHYMNRISQHVRGSGTRRKEFDEIFVLTLPRELTEREVREVESAFILALKPLQQGRVKQSRTCRTPAKFSIPVTCLDPKAALKRVGL